MKMLRINGLYSIISGDNEDIATLVLPCPDPQFDGVQSDMYVMSIANKKLLEEANANSVTLGKLNANEVTNTLVKWSMLSNVSSLRIYCNGANNTDLIKSVLESAYTTQNKTWYIRLSSASDANSLWFSTVASKNHIPINLLIRKHIEHPDELDMSEFLEVPYIKSGSAEINYFPSEEADTVGVCPAVIKVKSTPLIINSY